MRNLSKVSVVAAAFFVLSTMILVGTAGAAHVSCGMTLTSNTTFDSNVTGCTQGLKVGAPSIKIDLNGFSLEGVSGTAGEGAGITTNGFGGVRVTGGTIKYFDAGVVIEGIVLETGVPDTIDVALTVGGGSRVDHMTVEDNIGNNLSDFGDGILIQESSFNRVDHNTARHNGFYSGIGTLGPVANNEIDNNTVVDNNVDQTATFNQDDGIRLEPRAVRTSVHDNTVTGSGLDGIANFNPSVGNVIRRNYVAGNGNHGKSHRPGDGIRLFVPDQAVVEENTICANAGNGIVVGNLAGTPGSGANLITNNNVGAGTVGCGANATAGVAATYDLNDQAMSTPVQLPPTPPGVPCLTNVWRGNFTAGDTFNHNCTTNP